MYHFLLQNAAVWGAVLRGVGLTVTVMDKLYGLLRSTSGDDGFMPLPRVHLIAQKQEMQTRSGSISGRGGLYPSSS